jgi:hypothetical protein
VRHPARVRSALLLLWVLVAAGCVSRAEMDRLESRIADAGYTEVSVGHSVTTGGYDSVRVLANKPSVADEGTELARLVWNTYVEEVDEVVVVLNGVTLGGTREQLQEAFGPRPIDQDPGEETDPGEILLWAAGVISTIVLVVKVLGLLGRRRRS